MRNPIESQHLPPGAVSEVVSVLYNSTCGQTLPGCAQVLIVCQGGSAAHRRSFSRAWHVQQAAKLQMPVPIGMTCPSRKDSGALIAIGVNAAEHTPRSDVTTYQWINSAV